MPLRISRKLKNETKECQYPKNCPFPPFPHLQYNFLPRSSTSNFVDPPREKPKGSSIMVAAMKFAGFCANVAQEASPIPIVNTMGIAAILQKNLILQW
eukprot:15366814-Ditylum_brightwellii.AAC.4